MEPFKNDDEGYRNWCNGHQSDGFIMNNVDDRGRIRIHRVDGCYWIKNSDTKKYRKLVGTDFQELAEEAIRRGTPHPDYQCTRCKNLVEN